MWSGRYYYRHIRTPQGPRRQYVGGGTAAAIMAQQDEAERRQRAQAADKRRQEVDQDRQIDAMLDKDYRSLHNAVAAVLVASGWHRHKRQWRRTINILENHTMGDKSAADVYELMKRCDTPNPAAGDLAQLRRAVAAGAGPLALGGDAIRTRILGECDVKTLAVVKGELDRLALDLGAADAPAVERQLIDHAVTCWLRMQLAELAYTQAITGSHTTAAGAYRDKMLEGAQRRYLRAIVMLTRLRGMAITGVQINVANNQQVNNFSD